MKKDVVKQDLKQKLICKQYKDTDVVIYFSHCTIVLFLNRVISKEEFLGEPAPKSSSRRGSATDPETKADLAFNVFDKNHDGYVTKGEMLKTSKNLTKKQVSLGISYKLSLNR